MRGFCCQIRRDLSRSLRPLPGDCSCQTVPMSASRVSAGALDR
jgi:hypothetical protein